MNQIPYPYDINTTKVRILNNKLREVPEWIQYLPNLEQLDLDRNRISIIPEWLGNMTNLKYLSLTHNTIYDLPFSLSNLINLESIRLHTNHFPPVQMVGWLLLIQRWVHLILLNFY